MLIEKYEKQENLSRNTIKNSTIDFLISQFS